MSTNYTEEEIMTDFQFKALMTMVLDIVRSAETKEQIEESLEKLASGDLNSRKPKDK